MRSLPVMNGVSVNFTATSGLLAAARSGLVKLMVYMPSLLGHTSESNGVWNLACAAVTLLLPVIPPDMAVAKFQLPGAFGKFAAVDAEPAVTPLPLLGESESVPSTRFTKNFSILRWYGLVLRSGPAAGSLAALGVRAEL